MAKRIKVKLSKGAVRELLTSPEMEDAVTAEADKRAPTGSGYEVLSDSSGGRARARIGATTWGAYHDNARNATLLKSLGGG